MTLRPSGRPSSRCLEERVPDYVSGALDAGTRRRVERHLVSCEWCRREVEVERRLQATLRRSDPSVPGDLRALLLAVALDSAEGAETDARSGTGAASQVDGPADRGPAGWRHVRIERGSAPRPAARAETVPVLSPHAPAYHRSALRSTVLATLAAGIGAAAAWGLAVAGTGPVVPIQPVPGVAGGDATPAAQRTGPPASGAGAFLGTVTVWSVPRSWFTSTVPPGGPTFASSTSLQSSRAFATVPNGPGDGPQTAVTAQSVP